MSLDQRTVNFEEINAALPPLHLYRRLAREFDSSFMLESAVGDQRTVAYSFLGFGPESVLACRDGEVQGGESDDHLRAIPLEFLRETIRRNSVASSPFPFAGGLVGYFSYEFASQAEPSFPSYAHSSFPDFELGLYKEGVIYDHSSFRCYYFHMEEKGELFEMLLNPPSHLERDLHVGPMRPSTEQEGFEASVRDAKLRIRDGEVFQVVLSRSLSARFDGDPLRLYEQLRTSNPSPYMFYLDFGERKVLGSSPETLLTVRGREATTFPIAGTRSVGNGPKEHRRLREEMLTDEKERAEHCMLVDLARNDLGKVSEFGSVHVPEYMSVASYSHVQHLVSKVSSTLAPKMDSIAALAAVFPAGTVSGAPKPRAMRIISELEGRPRGAYAGGVGYLSFTGDLDSAITIRSAFADRDIITFQAGAGIVSDSDPAREFVETEHKLGALQAALQRLRASTQKEEVAA